MRKLEQVIAITMIMCSIGSLVSLFFCTDDFEMMMTTVAFILSGAVGMLASASFSSATKY
jgi:lipoprotein signal peptidase